MSQLVIIMKQTELQAIVAQAVYEGVQSAIRSGGLGKYSSDSEMDEKEAALYLNISAQTLRSWRVQKVGPAYHKSGRAVRYSKADLDAWKSSNRVLTADCQEIRRRHHEMSR